MRLQFPQADAPSASALFVVLPHDQDLSSSAGTVLTNAIQSYLSHKQTFGLEEEALLAHEVFHTWNPHRIGLPPENGEKVSWFTEGFTTYYQERIRSIWSDRKLAARCLRSSLLICT